MIAQLTAQVREMTARVEEAVTENGQLTARVEALERRAGKDSSTSSKPPSSDSPYGKKPRDRLLREKGKRAPGKQPGEPGTTMRLVDDRRTGSGTRRPSAGGAARDWPEQEIFAQRRHQVTDIRPAPAPEVTEHVAQSEMCPCCGTVSEGELPAGMRARAGDGPEAHAQAALLTCGNYIPVGRAAELMAQLAGLRASVGWIAGVGKAAALVESSGFMDLVAGLLRQAEAVHADETPARAAGGLRYVHLACTRWLTRMHTGDRFARRRSMPAACCPDTQGIHRPRRLPRRIRAPHGRAARLVRRPSPARPEGPLPVRAREAGLGGADGRLRPRGPRRRPRRPRGGGRRPWTRPSSAG